MEYKNGKLQLPNVTLVAVTSVKVKETIKALEYSMKDIDFGDVTLITHRKPFFLPKTIRYQHIKKLKNIDDFNYTMVYNLGDYIKTDFILLVHYDGFVVNPKSWKDEFLDYDYIGSPWPMPKDDFSYRDINGEIQRVGNSVSIRSKRLLDYPKQSNMKWEADHGFFHEDGFICVKNHHIFEAAGMRIAPLEVAKDFGREHPIPENENVDPFIFHKWYGPNKDYPHF